MPRITVNGVLLAYEIFGEGPPVVFTAGAWGGLQPSLCAFLGRMSSKYRILIYALLDRLRDAI